MWCGFFSSEGLLWIILHLSFHLYNNHNLIRQCFFLVFLEMRDNVCAHHVIEYCTSINCIPWYWHYYCFIALSPTIDISARRRRFLLMVALTWERRLLDHPQHIVIDKMLRNTFSGSIKADLNVAKIKVCGLLLRRQKRGGSQKDSSMANELLLAEFLKVVRSLHWFFIQSLRSSQKKPMTLP